jgi:hypothetical protein
MVGMSNSLASSRYKMGDVNNWISLKSYICDVCTYSAWNGDAHGVRYMSFGCSIIISINLLYCVKCMSNYFLKLSINWELVKSHSTWWSSDRSKGRGANISSTLDGYVNGRCLYLPLFSSVELILSSRCLSQALTGYWDLLDHLWFLPVHCWWWVDVFLLKQFTFFF